MKILSFVCNPECLVTPINFLMTLQVVGVERKNRFKSHNLGLVGAIDHVHINTFKPYLTITTKNVLFYLRGFLYRCRV